MCGLYGASIRKGKKIDLKKIKTLGVYNIQRGTDSCGYYYSGNVVKGIDKEANFTKFIDKNPIVRGDLNGEVFMGHTRKSTYGSNTAENAHPHVVGNYVQTHNGTITTPWELCNKYNVDHKDITVDSIGLARIIEKVGFEVLNQYKGYAALTMTFMDDNESLYLYHGASRDKENGEMWEERPMYYLEQPEGIYYSSIEESLNFISSNKKKAETLPHNVVYKITNGEFTDFEYVVKREDNNITKAVKTYPTYNYYQGGYTPPKQAAFDWATPLTNETKNNKPDILLEEYPDEFIQQDVYYRRGRYYREENILLDGKYKISRDGIIVNENANVSASGRQAEYYYFIRGVMMASENLYNKLINSVDDSHNDLNKNNAYYLSACSRYAVTAIETESLMIGKEIKRLWYKNGSTFSGTFTPKFSKRSYKIHNGELKAITGDTGELFLDALPHDYIDVIDTQDVKPQDCCEIPNANLTQLVDIVCEYTNKNITEQDVKTLPEVFLKLIDCYVYSYLKDASDKDIESETTLILKDLIHSKSTLAEYLAQYLDHTFVERQNIYELFKHDDHEDILFEQNRYEFIDFENKEGFQENIEDLKELLVELNKKADGFQIMPSESAQDIAFTIYQNVSVIEKAIKEVEIKK